MSIRASQRTRIVQGLAKHLSELYGPGGSRQAVLRKKVRHGGWAPGRKPRPQLTVVDDGQQRAGFSDAEQCKEMLLDVRLVLDLEDNWDREETYKQWTDFVADLIEQVSNVMVPGTGMTRAHYRDDDPIDVVLQSGDSEQIWTIGFDVRYVMHVPEVREIT